MPAARRRLEPRNPLWFNRLLRISFGAWLRRAYRIEPRGLDLFKELKPPYLLIGNHVSSRDPFILGSLCPAPVYWVTGDGTLRHPLLRALLLGLVGSIPKSKAIPDSDTVRTIVDLIRKKKAVVGVFPEGQASWDGRSLPILPSTAKLAKLLKVPVVAARIEGGFFTLPRWSWKRRPGRLIVSFSRIISAEELRVMDAETVLKRMEAALAHDEYAAPSLSGGAWDSGERAESLELCLYTCPACGASGSMRGEGRRLTCLSCGDCSELGRDMRFRRVDGAAPRFSTIPAWSDWQDAAVRKTAGEAAKGKPGSALIEDEGAVILKGRRMNPLTRIGEGRVRLFPDRLELFASGSRRGSEAGKPLVSLRLADMEGLGVFKQNRFEFYLGRDLIQLRFRDRRVSAKRWMDFCLALKAAAAG